MKKTKSKTAQTSFIYVNGHALACPKRQLVLKNTSSVDLQYLVLNYKLKFNIKPTFSFQDT